MVEGGAAVITTFLETAASPQSMVDALIVTIAPTLVGSQGVGFNNLNQVCPRTRYVCLRDRDVHHFCADPRLATHSHRDSWSGYCCRYEGDQERINLRQPFALLVWLHRAKLSQLFSVSQATRINNLCDLSDYISSRPYGAHHNPPYPSTSHGELPWRNSQRSRMTFEGPFCNRRSSLPARRRCG
jgi:hypothetical protein